MIDNDPVFIGIRKHAADINQLPITVVRLLCLLAAHIYWQAHKQKQSMGEGGGNFGIFILW